MDTEKLRKINDLHDQTESFIKFQQKANKSYFMEINIGSFNSNVKDHETIRFSVNSEFCKNILRLIDEESERLFKEFNEL
jgi:DNA mismatch repair ATPase MutS